MMFILDTHVVSELRKIRLGKADIHVAAWADGVDAADLYVSVITIQEIEMGILLLERRDSQQGVLFRNWFNDQVLPTFANRILSVDKTVALRSAQINVPNPRPVRDGLIAATALVHGMTVVTRNVADFEPTGALVLNPWLAAAI
jgi:toxin FitB